MQLKRAELIIFQVDLLLLLLCNFHPFTFVHLLDGIKESSCSRILGLGWGPIRLDLQQPLPLGLNLLLQIFDELQCLFRIWIFYPLLDHALCLKFEVFRGWGAERLLVCCLILLQHVFHCQSNVFFHWWAFSTTKCLILGLRRTSGDAGFWSRRCYSSYWILVKM